jgi:hypothetical protein
MRAAAIELTVEELVLHGFAAGDRYAIAEAVERELTRLLGGQGVPLSLMHGGERMRLGACPSKAAPTLY